MKLENYGRYGLHVIQYPSGKFGYVGNVPSILCVEKKMPNKLPCKVSMCFDTEQEAINHFEKIKHLLCLD